MTSTDTQTAGAQRAPAIEDVLALSPLQLGLYSMAALSDGDTGRADPYIIAMAADIDGALDVDLLRNCATAMLVRHPNLRAAFFRGDLRKPVQVIPRQVRLPWRHITAPDRDTALRLEAQDRRRPFDLARGPAIRFLLVELPDGHWRLAVVAHHIVIDGWSLPLFVGELIALYQSGADAAALPPAPRPYRDYIGWLAGRDEQQSLALWRSHLDGLAEPTLLTPALTSAEPAPGLPVRAEVRLDEAATASLVAAARARGVTVNTLVQLAWALILSSCVGRSDVVFGVTVSGRPGEITGVESMIGLFINTVPLRVRLDPAATVGQSCLALQREAAALRDHSYLSHTDLRALAGVGEMFDTLLVYENFPPGGLVGGGSFTVGGATFAPAALESLAHFPVTIAAHLAGDRLTVLVESLPGALGEMSRESLGRRVVDVVGRLLDGWDAPLRDVSLLADGESPAPRTPAEMDAAGSPAIHLRFAEIAAARSDQVALTFDGGSMSYGELDRAADLLAADLLDRGVRPEQPVAIVLGRGPRYVVAMLAVLKAGAMIVPLEPGMPADRIADILAQCGAQLVIDESWPLSTTDLGDYRPVRTAPDAAAYAVFTSGTTGKPKGVIGTHRAVLAYAVDHAAHVLRPAADRLGRPLRIAHGWSFTFDAAWQPLAGLLDGHSVHIIGDDIQRDAEKLVDTIDERRIDLIDTTPSMFAQLHAAGLLTRVPLPVLALGGEAIGTSTWAAIRDACARAGMTAYNCYGPTETTVEAVVAEIHCVDHPVIGSPTGGTGAAVLDSWLRPVPDGAAGELYLSGDQLTRGYLGRAGETSTRYVADPTRPGQRMYRTGDLARRGADGSLRYLGRSDEQVKIRGYRVEPGEVVAVLMTHPEVRAAHVAVRRYRSGPRLVAYLDTGDANPSVAEIRDMLSSRLPRYLVPHRILTLDGLPLTVNGKVDDRALAALDGTEDSGSGAAPETDTEKALAEIVAELLEAPSVDVTAELLSLGLDSIVALSVVQAARRRGIPVRARLLLECDSIRDLAAAIDEEDTAHADPTPAPAAQGSVDAPGLFLARSSLVEPGGGPIPALPNARWLYQYGDPRRLVQTEAIRLPNGVTGDQLRALLAAAADAHEVLRCRYDPGAATLIPDADGPQLREVEVTGDLGAAVAEATRAAVEDLDPVAGRLLIPIWLRGSGHSVLVLTGHVLALDPASWRILIAELDAGWHALAGGGAARPVRERTSYRQWSTLLGERARQLDSVDFWAGQLDGPDPALGARRLRPDTDRAAELRVTVSISDPQLSAALLANPGEITDRLARAAAIMIMRWRARRGEATPTPLLAVETHGRADAVVDPDGATDTAETLGLLSAIYPVRVSPVDGMPEIPGDGIDYGLLRYLRDDTAQRLAALPEPQLMLNYLGRTEIGRGGAATQDRSLLAGASLIPEPNLAVRHELTIIAAVMLDPAGSGEPVLATQWRWLPEIFTDDDIAVMQQLWQEALS
ncbi:non-ribosomal peptide synthetase [Mycolicibacterium brumae]|uniref:Non-ribosomal peptide synthetase n=1 Tax=Mycolicibacterium brumae TaxID=85968 RepID=A0A2G5P8H7_9MYCO|nr:non-ribosomal peptide synthetase [Mycolicibacterium brumae]MCV7194766.1 non-ribosomal peptide synthetase [Mycolicibacterium brumae]PIB74313.1 non-ribosomal peptide synthetase [Mycolicibacterium brumae]UWW08201.1 non-ribosomal peptide synthetase [Mycolicibacterium brumae]